MKSQETTIYDLFTIKKILYHLFALSFLSVILYISDYVKSISDLSNEYINVVILILFSIVYMIVLYYIKKSSTIDKGLYKQNYNMEYLLFVLFIFIIFLQLISKVSTLFENIDPTYFLVSLLTIAYLICTYFKKHFMKSE